MKRQIVALRGSQEFFFGQCLRVQMTAAIRGTSTNTSRCSPLSRTINLSAIQSGEL